MSRGEEYRKIQDLREREVLLEVDRLLRRRGEATEAVSEGEVAADGAHLSPHSRFQLALHRRLRTLEGVIGQNSGQLVFWTPA
jgi:hypothetical protein